MLSMNVDLINKEYGNEFESHLLRQYELFVESSEKVSSKRMSVNKFYLGVNTGIFAIASYLAILKSPLTVILLSLVGTLICLSWINGLESYKRLNHAKFKIIHELENHLPAKIYSKEDEYLNKYYTLTNLEKFIPVVFIIFYALIVLYYLLPFSNWLIKIINGGY